MKEEWLWLLDSCIQEARELGESDLPVVDFVVIWPFREFRLIPPFVKKYSFQEEEVPYLFRQLIIPEELATLDLNELKLRIARSSKIILKGLNTCSFAKQLVLFLSKKEPQSVLVIGADIHKRRIERDLDKYGDKYGLAFKSFIFWPVKCSSSWFSFLISRIYETALLHLPWSLYEKVVCTDRGGD